MNGKFLKLHSTTNLLFSLLMLVCCLNVGAQQKESSEAASTRFGKHGMVVFGGAEGLYASHMPMFHAPHDYQVLIRFHLADRKIDKQLRRQLVGRPMLWSLDPENFDLMRLRSDHPQNLQQFTANLFEGHFERDGQERYAEQRVVVDEVLLFRHLAVQERQHTEGCYLLIGRGKEQFLMKEIDRRPDFDVVIALGKNARDVNPQFAQFPCLPSDTLSLPGVISSLLGSKVAAAKLLYFETEDLK